MKLKKIKVYGFKSFVDTTTVVIKGKIVGVVGPNGCGKSNVIDAVRWVMGESSAKMMRGAAMTDVIFNGSRVRKPVGKASVELLFDNSLGRVSTATNDAAAERGLGHYKDFAEISIQRTLSRDGKSNYRINDNKVRRKDVLDLFRGTGLGPRSYSIIEQGMVSRIVEAKPEELRSFVEEAAGISRYKDRRRETENRIRNTRENLERVEDIRGELLNQLRRLKRQASSAERYKTLQNDKRQRQGELYVLKVRELDAFHDEDILKVAKARNQLEAALSAQRERELELEQQRQAQTAKQDALNVVQSQFYEVSSSVSRMEQQIEYQQNAEVRSRNEMSEITSVIATVADQIQQDEEKFSQLQAEIEESTPQLVEAEDQQQQFQSSFNTVSEARNRWQDEWNQFNQSVQKPAHQKQVQLSLIEQIQRQGQRSLTRQAQLQGELVRMSSVQKGSDLSEKQAMMDDQRRLSSAKDQQQEDFERQLIIDRELQKKLQEQLADKRSLLQVSQSRLNSLLEIQRGALDSSESSFSKWLAQSGLSGLEQFAGRLKVSTGWERAADRVLGDSLRSLIDGDAGHSLWFKSSERAVSFISNKILKLAEKRMNLPTLNEVVVADGIDISGLVGTVYLAEDMQAASEYRAQLHHNERIVTKDGVLMGANWLSHASEDSLNTGFLVREEEIHSLQAKAQSLEKEVEPLATRLNDCQANIKTSEQTLHESRSASRQFTQALSQLESEVGRLSAQLELQQTRQKQVEFELSELSAHQEEERQRLEQAQQSLELASEQAAELDIKRTELAEQGQQYRQGYETAMRALRQQQEAVHQLSLYKTRQEAAAHSLSNSLQRLVAQQAETVQKQQQLAEQMKQVSAPLLEMKAQLTEALDLRGGAEQNLQESRERMSENEEMLRALQVKHAHCLKNVATAREQLERDQMGLQSVKTRQETLGEEIERENFDLKQISETMQEGLALHELKQKISALGQKIDRIGPVNLVAIEEYESQNERAEYLHKQHADLSEALHTLETVIAKIDKETKIRFADTYNELNKQFTLFFPKLFGGGHASLELTSDDWLTTGIAVTAQPPGKRNSTIQLLSGGEKALTAVSLLFALFELNPAPFCMMDEVDAPLDDANVVRFCETLKSLSERTQIVVITHNKITMQIADNLIGVTHNEPGVSRVVSVNIDDAMALADV